MSKSKTRRERSRKNKRMIVLGLVGAYLCGLIIGCVIIWAIPTLKNRHDLLVIANDKGVATLSLGHREEVLIFGMEHWLYDSSYRLIHSENSFLHNSQREYINSFAPKVFQQGQIYVPTLLLMDNRSENPHYIFGIVIGVVVEGPNGKPYASILVRDLTDLDSTITTYIALFTFMYGIAIVCGYHIINKERELNRIRRNLFANVSHELKTPITAIRAMAETLHDGMIKDQETKQTYSKQIIEESNKLEQLVLDILELSKLQSNRAEFKKTTAYADGIIPPVVDRYMMLCGDLGITLDTSKLTLENVPALYTDSDKLITLINTLMDNAVKFTGTGGTIWFSNQIHSKSVTFCIRDNGPGIQPKDVNRIFERFYKADISHNSSGSGLGLAIADEIAKGLGEKLWVESTYGVGTSFFFTVAFKSGG